MTARPGARPLPQPPGGLRNEAAWYEHEERMRPSYIAPQQQQQQQAYYNQVGAYAQQQQQQQSGGYGGAGYAQPQRQAYASQQQPPTSPSARYQQQQQPRQAAYPFPGEQQQQPNYNSGALPPGAQAPYPYASQQQQAPPRATSPGSYDYPVTPNRPRHSSMQPFPAHRLPNSQDPGYGGPPEAFEGMRGGTAFVHKGFFDIMNLVNSSPAPGPARTGQNPPGSPSRIKATLSRATGGLRKATGGGGRDEDPFGVGGMRGGSPLTQVSSTAQSSTTTGQSSYDAPAVRAAKKRISIDMVGAPQAGTFVHAAHASDAEQAEEILRRWGREGVGKVADPAWVAPIKQAMRQQALRNQAEAIAQVQAAMHQDSVIREQPRQLHIMNGTPSASVTASNLTATTITQGTLGHGSSSIVSSASPMASPGVTQMREPFLGIAEELRGSDGEARDDPTLQRMAPPSPSPRRTTAPVSPTPNRQQQRPPAMPRSNTAGTVLVAQSPDAATLAAMEAPDYLAYRPAAAGGGGMNAPAASSGKNIDGLPGAAPGGIGALFDARPVSMVVRDIDGLGGPSASPLTVEPLAPTLELNAGLALRPSLTTVEKSVAAKIFFENLYYGILKAPRARDTRRAGLEAELASLRIPESSKEAIRTAWSANETEYLRDIRARVNVNSFARLKTIGHGAFGVVALVRERGTGELFAMKQLRKADMLRKGQEGHVRAERDLMTSASAGANAKWIVKLVYSFQDVDHLYLIMEFMGGGDLLNLLIEKDIFPEDFAKFYVAEMILAVHEAHRLGYIHRDIKPDNFLYTSKGHIKLADFGLCQSFHWAHDGAYYDQQRKNLLKKHGIDLEDSRGAGGAVHRARAAAKEAEARGKTPGAGLDEKELGEVMSDRNQDGTPLTHVLTWRDKNKKQMAFSVVGTNNYMAPEVLRGLGYDQSCDWWSLGVIVFEMLYGYPPFVSKSRHLTRQKILNWRQTLRFPPKPKVSREAQDFISRLICEKDDRLGSTSNASVSRPNSLLQGSRQRSGFVAAGGAQQSAAPGLADGVDDLMAHPWFRGVDWATIHTQKAPFKPALSHPADTKHFEDGIEDEPLPAPGAAEALKNGQAVPVEQPRDPMLRDKEQGEHLLEMRKQLAFVGYTFKSPKQFDPRTQLSESKIIAAERTAPVQQQQLPLRREPTEGGSRLRSMSM